MLIKLTLETRKYSRQETRKYNILGWEKKHFTYSNFCIKKTHIGKGKKEIQNVLEEKRRRMRQRRDKHQKKEKKGGINNFQDNHKTKTLAKKRKKKNDLTDKIRNILF